MRITKTLAAGSASVLHQLLQLVRSTGTYMYTCTLAICADLFSSIPSAVDPRPRLKFEFRPRFVPVLQLTAAVHMHMHVLCMVHTRPVPIRFVAQLTPRRPLLLQLPVSVHVHVVDRILASI